MTSFLSSDARLVLQRRPGAIADIVAIEVDVSSPTSITETSQNILYPSNNKSPTINDDIALAPDRSFAVGFGMAAIGDLVIVPFDGRRAYSSVTKFYLRYSPIHLLSHLDYSSSRTFAEALDPVLNTLRYREREMLKLSTGIGDGFSYTRSEIGRIVKVSPPQFSSLLKDVRHRLSEPEVVLLIKRARGVHTVI